MADDRVAQRLFPAYLCACALLLAAPHAFAQDASGEGDGLKIAVDPASHVITGYFETGSGDDGHGGPQFSCIFYLRGKAEGKLPYRIVTWFPADPKTTIAGTVDFSRETTPRTVTIRLPSDHGGCGMAQSFVGPEGTTLTLDATQPWIAVRVVSAKQAHFHPPSRNLKQPPGPPSHAYVVRGNALGISTTQPGWVLADFTTAGGKTIKGWVKDDDLFEGQNR